MSILIFQYWKKKCFLKGNPPSPHTQTHKNVAFLAKGHGSSQKKEHLPCNLPPPSEKCTKAAITGKFSSRSPLRLSMPLIELVITLAPVPNNSSWHIMHVHCKRINSKLWGAGKSEANGWHGFVLWTAERIILLVLVQKLELPAGKERKKVCIFSAPRNFRIAIWDSPWPSSRAHVLYV